MSESQLNQIVKGAPPPSRPIPILPTSGVTSTTTSITTDPLACLPSSPPQIYLNLLILEASLRAQYLELRARRRQYTFFMFLLAAWLCLFTYLLFLAPREDGSGVGGSVYWVVELIYRMCFMGGVITGLLVWGTGQWERGIRWPRRWVGTTNRGLRGFNCKIVLVKGPWWKEYLSSLSFLFSSSLFFSNGSSSYRHVDASLLPPAPSPTSSTYRKPSPSAPSRTTEEDLSPGGDTLALLLLPKPFSPAFRENWDLYRTEYWERENLRRQNLRVRLRAHDAKARAARGWFARWRAAPPPSRDVEKSQSHSHGHAHSHSTHSLHRGGGGGGGSQRSNHSRNSSRSTTPTGEEVGERVRRGSGSSARRKKVVGLTPSNSTVAKVSRAGTPVAGLPETSSPLVRENSFGSVESLELGERGGKPIKKEEASGGEKGGKGERVSSSEEK